MNAQNLALMTSRLYLPLVVREILESPAPIAEDMQYSLHTVLSDYRPDSALLAIALSAKKILGAGVLKGPQARVLEMACDKIVEEYGERWLRNFHNQEASESFLLDVLELIAEDLQALSDLMKALGPTAGDTKVQALLRILEVQALAQAVIADELVNIMDCEFMQDGASTPVFTAPVLIEEEFSELELDMARCGDCDTQWSAA